MATADRHIGDLNVELTRGQGRSIKLTSLLTDTSTSVGQWSAVAGANGSQAPTCTEDSGSLLVSWSDSQATASIGRSWRLRLDGDDVAGGRVVEARPQATPGTASVAIQVDPLSEVTTTVVVTPAGPKGDQGDQGDPGDPGPPVDLSSATPAPLGTAAAGAATAAAKGDHVHAMPSAADVGADPTGSATSAVSGHVADTDPHGDRAYTDTGIAALPSIVVDDTLSLTPTPGYVTLGHVGADVQDFSTAGTATWTKPAGASLVIVVAVGGGGGGGSGRKGAESSARFGGCGGYGASMIRGVFPASSVTDSVTVTVGAGSAGAAAQTTNSTDGNSAAQGGSSSFGAYLVAQGGAGGLNGTATARTASTPQASQAMVGLGGMNGVGGLTIDVAGAILGQNGFCGGGGGGGWRSAANAWAVIVGLAGSGVGANAPGAGNGTAGANGTGPLGGSGGFGGVNGTAGGAGGYPGGGGGGGSAGINSSTNGTAGGAGGKGFVRVITLR